MELPPPTALPELIETRTPHGTARPMSAAQLVAEGRRAVVRALRRRLAELDTSAFEALCSSLLEKMGMRDVRVAKRSKEGPLYLARQRRGVSDLRVAVKLVRGAREISRADVQELRKDLAHYSAQMGLVLAPGEAGREARGEASAAGQAPVALYAGDALPEEMIAVRVGVTVQTVDVPDMDEGFFAGLSRHREERPRREREEPRPAAEQPEPAPPQPEPVAEEAPPAPAAVEAAPEAPPEAVPVTEVPETTEDPARGETKRRRGRDDKPRATTPAEQAWGQPAGTLRFAAPPGPTVATTPAKEAETTAENATASSPEPEPEDPVDGV